MHITFSFFPQLFAFLLKCYQFTTGYTLLHCSWVGLPWCPPVLHQLRGEEMNLLPLSSVPGPDFLLPLLNIVKYRMRGFEKRDLPINCCNFLLFMLIAKCVFVL